MRNEIEQQNTASQEIEVARRGIAVKVNKWLEHELEIENLLILATIVEAIK